MKHEVIIQPEAKEDLREAFLWYENKRKGLGHDVIAVLHGKRSLKIVKGRMR